MLFDDGGWALLTRSGRRGSVPPRPLHSLLVLVVVLWGRLWPRAPLTPRSLRRCRTRRPRCARTASASPRSVRRRDVPRRSFTFLALGTVLEFALIAIAMWAFGATRGPLQLRTGDARADRDRGVAGNIQRARRRDVDRVARFRGARSRERVRDSVRSRAHGVGGRSRGARHDATRVLFAALVVVGVARARVGAPRRRRRVARAAIRQPLEHHQGRPRHRDHPPDGRARAIGPASLLACARSARSRRHQESVKANDFGFSKARVLVMPLGLFR